MNKRIGFVGAGQMAIALAGGFLRKQITIAENLFAFDVSGEAAQTFQEKTGATIVGSIKELLEQVGVLFLAVKPQQISVVLSELKNEFSPKNYPLIVSIAAGIRLAVLEEFLGQVTPLVRVMPNTPCLIGSGVCGFCASNAVSDEESAFVQALLETVGLTVKVPEKLLDAVTGLSGSGPAYVDVIVEALSDGGVLMGLPRHIATQLAAQTVKGAAELILRSSEHPAVLKDRVASPGGTTIAGLAALEKGGLRSALISAVVAATERSEELSQQKNG